MTATMSSGEDQLFARLAQLGVDVKKPAAGQPKKPATGNGDEKLDKLLERISKLTGEPVVKPQTNQPETPRPEPPPQSSPPQRAAADLPEDETPSAVRQGGEAASESASAEVQGEAADFVPLEPNSFVEAAVTEGQVEALALKFLLAIGTASGRQVAAQLKLPFKLVDGILRQMKTDQLAVYYGSAPMNDYVYQLTDTGRDRARQHSLVSTYFGSAPVSLQQYIESVKAQSLTKQHPNASDLKKAFADLLISPKMLTRLGPAINSGRGLFLYGAPGNGKTSIAERVTAAFGQHIWIPRAIGVDGEIMRLFDPSNHEEVPLESQEGLLDHRKIDKRWVRIQRPTIVVGGELTMDSLEVTLNTSTGVSEAPLQLKSNCGTLVIDDFGRQKMSVDQLLNRWIVPLEKRYDFLNLCNGKKLQVPFDQLIIFSTNLEPKDLVDDAFLRRIPYKIQVIDPTEEEFRALFSIMAKIFKLEFNQSALDYLIETHYKAVDRPFRCCQPRDLIMQIRNYCHYMDRPAEMSPELFDFAVENYFAIM